MGSRNWCFTINNPNLDDYPESWSLNHLKTVLYQVETGEAGTIHLQGYVEINNPRVIGWLKGLNARAHWEVRRGTRSQAILYCCKEDTRLVRPRLWTSRDQLWEDLDPDNISSSLNSRGITLETYGNSTSGNHGLAWATLYGGDSLNTVNKDIVHMRNLENAGDQTAAAGDTTYYST